MAASSRYAYTRRNLLLSGALGSAAALAGCLGSDSDDGAGGNGGNGDDDTGDTGGAGGTEDSDGTPANVHVEGQNLRLVTPNNPEEMHFAWDFARDMDIELETPVDVYAALHEPGIWGRWWDSAYANDMGENFYGTLSDVSLKDDARVLRAEIDEDANWSDGEPVRAFDAVGLMALWRGREVPTEEQAESDDYVHPTETTPEEYTGLYGSIGHVEMPDGEDGKVLEYHAWDAPDWQERPWERAMGWRRIMYFLASWAARFGPRLPTHVEPWKSLTEERYQLWEDHGWYSDDPTPSDSMVKFVADRIEPDDVRATREPGNFPTNGAWALGELRGTEEVVLVPNEYSPHYEDINFDRVIFEYSEEDQRTQASLKTGRLDYAQLNVQPETSQGFPDFYQEVGSPRGWGNGIGFDHSHPHFGDRRVRQAVKYALNEEHVAQNVHATAAVPITIPGYHTWASDAVFEEEWAMENLIEYEYDADRAAELMREAGFERPDDVWQKDGEPLQATLATSETDNPVFENTVASQLQDFGIAVDFQTYDGATYLERWEGSNSLDPLDEEYGGDGAFDVWSEGMFTGMYSGLAADWWGNLATRSRVRARNFFDHEAQEAALVDYAESGWVAGLYGLWEEWTIDVPSEIGNPDSELEPFNPSYTYGATLVGPHSPRDPQPDNPYYDPPRDEPHDENLVYFYQKFAWLVNWHLPTVPTNLQQNQHWLNTQNWNWPKDHDMWEYFGLGWNASDLTGMNRIAADPENPKDGAETVEL